MLRATANYLIYTVEECPASAIVLGLDHSQYEVLGRAQGEVSFADVGQGGEMRVPVSVVPKSWTPPTNTPDKIHSTDNTYSHRSSFLQPLNVGCLWKQAAALLLLRYGGFQKCRLSLIDSFTHARVCTLPVVCTVRYDTDCSRDATCVFYVLLIDSVTPQ